MVLYSRISSCWQRFQHSKTSIPNQYSLAHWKSCVIFNYWSVRTRYWSSIVVKSWSVNKGITIEGFLPIPLFATLLAGILWWWFLCYPIKIWRLCSLIYNWTAFALPKISCHFSCCWTFWKICSIYHHIINIQFIIATSFIWVLLISLFYVDYCSWSTSTMLTYVILPLDHRL